ncbi:MAG TPA: MOSC domain-containing protein [Chthoniobacteraceae bacterium]
MIILPYICAMISVAIRVRHLYLSRGHNFFGHHGRPAGEHEMIETTELRCVAGRGLVGDRFFDYKPDYNGQITFFAWEVYRDLTERFGRPKTPPSVFRRNVITEGLDLAAFIGREFDLQGIRFLGAQECAPCYWMDQAFAPGAEAALQGRGGLRAKILTDGALHTDVETPVASLQSVVPFEHATSQRV